MRRSLACVLVASLSIVGSPGVAGQVPRIVTAGDSWGGLIAPVLKQLLIQQGYGDVVIEAATGGTTAAAMATAAGFQPLLQQLALHPTIDAVHLSIGVNDLTGQWTAGLDPAAAAAVFDAIAASVTVVVQGVLAVRPWATVVLAGYDYPNFQEEVTSPPDQSCFAAWATLGFPTPQQMNLALAEIDLRLAAIAATDSRIVHFSVLGTLQTVFGYPGLGLPPGDPSLPNVALPSPPEAMIDCRHPNPLGYGAIAFAAVSTIYAGHLATPAHFAGSGEDLGFLSFLDGAGGPTVPVKPALAGQVLSFEVVSPGGGFAGAPIAVVAELFVSTTPPAPLPGFPEVAVSAAGVVFQESTLGGAPLPGVSVIPGLAGLTLVVQGIAVAPTAANGLFASSPAHLIVFL